MYCPMCGKQVNEAKFCPYCGTGVPTSDENSTTQESDHESTVNEENNNSNVADKKTKKKKKKIAITIISLVLCASLIVGAIFVVPLFFKDSEAVILPYSFGNYASFGEGFTDVKIIDGESAIKAVESVADVLGISNPKEELSVADTNKVGDDTFYRIQQYYQGVPVYGKSIAVAAYKDGSSAALTSNYTSIKKGFSLSCKISPEDAKSAAASHLGLSEIEVDGLDKSKVIYETENGAIVMAYCLNVNNYGTVIVDANTAEVLYASSFMNNATVEVKSADGSVTTTGSKDTDGKYVLHNEKYNIYIFDLHGKNCKKDGPNGKDSYDIRKYGVDTIKSEQNNNFNVKAVTLLNSLTNCSEFFNNLGHSGFDEIHGAINDSAEEGTNAFGGSKIIDGKSYAVCFTGSNYDLVNKKDVIGHEYTHGVFGSFITYDASFSKPIDAINEAYADIFGELIDAKLNKTSPDWVFCGNSLIDPESIGRPATFQRIADAKTFIDTYEFDKNDKRNLTFYTYSTRKMATAYSHFAKTIVSRAAYLMWNGIDGTQNRKIDETKLSQLWYQSMLLLQGDSDFSQCRNAVELSARMMVRKNQLTDEQYITIVSAFDQVGISRAVFSCKHTVKNDFELSVLSSDDSVELDDQATQETYFDLEVVKLEDGQCTRVMLEKEIESTKELHLDDGDYALRIAGGDATPINIRIKVDGGNTDAKDKIDIQTDFKSVIVVTLDDTSTESSSNDNTVPDEKDNNSSNNSGNNNNSKPAVTQKPSNSDSKKGQITQSEIVGKWKLTLSLDSFCDNIINGGSNVSGEDILAMEFIKDFGGISTIEAVVEFKSDGKYDMLPSGGSVEIFGSDYIQQNSNYKVNGKTIYFEVDEGADFGFNCEFNYKYDGTSITFLKNIEGVDHPYTGAVLTKIK